MARHLLLTFAILGGCSSPGGTTTDGPLTESSAATSSTDSSGTNTASTTTNESTNETVDPTETTTESDSADMPQPACGNGMLDPDEECDDANLIGFDGCSSNCHTEHEILDVVLGDTHTCAVTPAGVKCWGAAAGGVLGLATAEMKIGDEPGEMGPAIPYVDIGFEPVALSAGWGIICVIGSRGEVKCWGWNEWGQLGLGDTMDRGDDPGEMGDGLPTVDLVGMAHAVAPGEWNCAIVDDGVKCWGHNSLGQLGLGDTQDRGDQPGEMGVALPFVELGANLMPVAVAESCILDELGRVKCWGTNDQGTLGIGEIGNRGDQPGEMGDALPFIDFGVGVEVVQLARNLSTGCVLLDSGGIKCWGSTAGQWGALWPNAQTRTGDEPGEMGDALPELAVSGLDIVEVTVGGKFVCVLLEDGAVRCIGTNNWGQVGQGHTDPLDSWLDDVPNIDLAEPATRIRSTHWHTCAILQSGNLKCWGKNDVAQLGLGDTENRGDEPGEMGDALPYVELF